MNFIVVLVLFYITYIQGQRIETLLIGDSRYFVSDMWPYPLHFNFFLAYQYCRNSGMELLTMTKYEQSIQLIEFLKKSGKSDQEYWTSGNRLGSYPWTWMSTGHQFNNTFTLWGNGDRTTNNAKTDQNCMSLKSNNWAATNCTENRPFICQLTRCYYFNYVVTNRLSPGAAVKKTFPDTRTREASNPARTKIIAPNSKTSLGGPNSQPSTNTKVTDRSSRQPHLNLGPNKSSGIFLESLVPGLLRQNEIEPKNPTQEVIPPFILTQNEPGTPGPIFSSILQRKEAFSWALNDTTEI